MKIGDITQVAAHATATRSSSSRRMTAATLQPFDEARERDQRQVSPTSAGRDGEVPREAARQAIIEWKNDELKKAYDERAREQVKSGSGADSPRADGADAPTAGSRSGRARATSRSCASSSSRSRSTPSSRRSRAGAAGRIARRRSTGRCFPATASRGSIRADALPVLKCTGVVNIVSFDGEAGADSRPRDRQHPPAGRSELQYDPCPLIHEGMMVEVMHGPLKGVVGRLVRKGAHARLVLSVDLIGQAVSVEVDAADVKPY